MKKHFYYIFILIIISITLLPAKVSAKTLQDMYNELANLQKQENLVRR